MKPGIYDLSSAAYHADEIGCDAPSLSASIASILLRDSPRHAHAAHPLLGGGVREESETFDLGTAAHSYILEGRDDTWAVIDAPDWRTKAAKEARDLARDEGKTPILKRYVESVKAMSNAVRQQLATFTDSPAPLTNGKPEQVLVWFEPDHGVWCRSRLDWLHDDYSTIDDLKTGAGSANPDSWQRTIFSRDGDIQVGFYLRGLKAITGIDATFRWIVAENSYPFATSVISLTPEGLAHAFDRVEQAIQLWARCLKSDYWPGYPTRVCYIDPPPYVLARWMEQGDPLSLRGDGSTPLASSNWERS